MKLLLFRPPEPMMRHTDYTLGFLYVDGRPFCFTLEDTVRLIGEKVQDKTAIPEGSYSVIMSYSPHFKRVMPELLGVPKFSGIRIHPGNSALDTSGCILVGDSISISSEKPLRESVAAFNRLMEALEAGLAGEHSATIEIRGTCLS